MQIKLTDLIKPIELSEYCNKCPFGQLNYNFASAGNEISMIDRKRNETGTYGYVCSFDFRAHGEYTRVMRTECGKDIPKPEWCALSEMEGKS